MCRLFSLFLILVSIATGWREKLQEKYLVIVFLSAGSAVAFSCCWAALLLMGSGFPAPSSLPFPSFFFKLLGYVEERMLQMQALLWVMQSPSV